jgi:hypothetical protein
MRKLYSDGQQLHQYIKKKNNHIWPQVIEHKKTMKQMALEIQVQILDRHTNVVGSNGLMKFQPSSLF